MTRPWRRITLHLSQIALTLGLTFTRRPFQIGCLLVAVDDPTPSEVVRRELHHHAVLGKDPDVVLTHLAADVGENLVPVAQLDAEHGIRQGFHDGALDLDHAFFLRHVLHNLSVVCLPCRAPEPDWAGTGWPGNLHRERWWTSCSRSLNLFPGAPADRSCERILRIPGSREAPRSRPTLGRHASLRGNGRETRICPAMWRCSECAPRVYAYAALPAEPGQPARRRSVSSRA